MASEGMKFGINQSVNYVGENKTPPKIINLIIPPIRHLDTVGDAPPGKGLPIEKEKPKIPPKPEKKEVDSHNNDMVAIYAAAGVSSYLIIKYLL